MNFSSMNEKLRILRKLLGISLDVVADEVGISIGFLNRYERGFIKDVKNIEKKARLEFYIQRLEEKAEKLIKQL